MKEGALVGIMLVLAFMLGVLFVHVATPPRVNPFHDDAAGVTCWMSDKGGIACLQNVPIQAK